jgi:hypothetical protein
MGPVGFSETSVANYQRYVTAQKSEHLLYFSSPRVLVDLLFCPMCLNVFKYILVGKKLQP